MSKRRLTNSEQLRKLLKENQSDSTLIAELKAVEIIIGNPRHLAVPALIKFLTPDLQHLTKWFIAQVFEKIRDERIIRPMMRAAIAPANDGYRANFLWPLLKYDCTEHLKFFANFIVTVRNPTEAMMVAVMIIREMKGPFEPAVARICIRKLLAEVKMPLEAEWKLQTEAFRLEAADFIMAKYFNQMRQAYWKPRNGSVPISKTA